MRRLLAPLLSCTLATVAGAADTPLMGQVTIANGPRLTQHFQASVFGRMWTDPALAALRAKVDEAMPELEAELGFSPLALATALTSAQATMFGLSDGATPEQIAAFKQTPTFDIQVGLGRFAEQIFTKLKHQGDRVDLPGMSEAVIIRGSQTIVAHDGQNLLLASDAQLLPPSPIAPSPHDLTVQIDGRVIADTIRNTLPPDERAKADGVIMALARFLVPVDGHLDITPTHNASYTAAKTTLPYLTQADLAVSARLPANAYAVNVFGLDGGVLWDDLIAPLITAIAAMDGKTAAEVLAIPDQQLATLGATTTLTELARSIRGTFLFAQTPGAPLPGYTGAIPRSPALDQLLAIALKQIGNELPAEGESTPIALPNVPLPIHLIRDRTHWVVTSDAVLGSTWTTNADGGWLASPLGKLAAQKVAPKTFLISVSDAAAELRAMQGYLSMWLGMMPLEPKEKQAVMRGFASLMANAGLNHEVIQQRGDLLVSEGESLVGGSSVAVVAIIAAIAIPNLLESRVTANEAAAATILKSGVFPAQVQFQAGGYRDLDKDFIGEFGFFHELSGGKVAGRDDDLGLRLLTPSEAWNVPLPERNGYRFAMYLADGAGGAIGVGDAAPKQNPDLADDSERYFVAYAWPIDAGQGRKAFAITNAGTVYSIPADQLAGGQPAWNAVFGGEGTGWKHEPVWPLHQRRDGGPGPRPAPNKGQPEDAPAF